MLVLGIESSCDETGVALYSTDAGGGLLAHALHSQVRMHEDYGGVVPELASRDHVRRLVPLLRQVLADSGCSLAEIGAVAYTQGPGPVSYTHLDVYKRQVYGEPVEDLPASRAC